MPRLSAPDPKSIPDDVTSFLSKLPPDPMFAMLSHSVTTIQPLLGLARALYTSLELPARTRELAILTVAHEIDSTFVWTQHIPISRDAGVDDTTRDLIEKGDFGNGALSDADGTIIRFTAAIATGPHVSDELFRAARRFLSEREVVELLQVIGYYWTFSRVSTVLNVDVTTMYSTEYGSTFPE